MNILCIYPGATISGFDSHKIGGSTEATYINHGLAMISSTLKRENHKVWLLDLRAFRNWKDFEEAVAKQKFDIALVSFISVDESYAKKCLRITKKHHPDIPVVAGGIHLSVTQTQQFPNADCVILGEGEEAILDFVRTYQETGEIKPFYESNPIADLDALPFVDRELFNNALEVQSPILPLLPTPFITIVFSRGCPYHCSFCYPSRQLIAGRVKRCRSPENCIEEVQLLRRTGGVGSIMIYDDLFPEDTNWIEKFIELFSSVLPRIPFWLQMRSSFIYKHPDIIRELARIGLTWVSLGVESGSERMLKFLKKGTSVQQNIEAAERLHQNGVNIFCNYILGLPTETEEDTEATGRMLRKIRPAFHAGGIYTSYPGSDLYQYCLQNSLWEDGHYSMIRHPYERKIKGINYDYVFRKLVEFGQYKSDLRQWCAPIKVTIPKKEEALA